MRQTSASLVAMLLVLAAVADVEGQILVDDFQDGSAQGWGSGAPNPNPPINVANGGPIGAGDGSPRRAVLAREADLSWVVADTPFGWFYYDLETWQPGILPTHQGPLTGFAGFPVLESAALPAGLYTFHFGVDTIPNSQVDSGELQVDSVEVEVVAL